MKTRTRTAGPSPDPKLNELFRIPPAHGSPEGVEVPDRATGVLVRHSVAGAYATIKQNTAANVARQRGEIARPREDNR